MIMMMTTTMMMMMMLMVVMMMMMMITNDDDDDDYEYNDNAGLEGRAGVGRLLDAHRHTLTHACARKHTCVCGCPKSWRLRRRGRQRRGRTMGLAAGVI